MTELKPNYKAAWAFLERVHPGRIVTVTGVTLDKKSIPTESFGPDEEKKFLRWVRSCGKMPANLYFSIGEPLQRMSKKLERTDVRAVHYLHVDVDPKNGEDVAAEQARILAMLQDPPAGLPKPTGIVYSGGGYQAFWQLSEPIIIDGDMERAEDAKLYNIQIERIVEADQCHNIDRIMRLPGTINVPDKKKEKKGRVAALAAVVEWHDDRVYELKQFVKAPIVQSTTTGLTSGAGIGVAPTIKAPSNVSRLNHIDDLGKGVSDVCKVVIVQGHNPNEPDRWPSRSETLFWVACELIRADISEDTIYSVLTDPDFRISESVLEKGNGAERYALRQIERAKEEADEPILREFNDRFAVVENYGGKCVVIEEVVDERMNRSRLVKQDFTNFRNRFLNRQVVVGQKTDKKGAVVGDIEMPAGEWWLRHSDRRQYERVVFAPGRDLPGSYNLWQGFGCEARPGDCSLFLSHLRDIVCGGNVDHYNYLVAWMANCVQRPGEQGHTAIVMRGLQGCGKSIIPELFGQLFGRHYIPVSNSKHLVGNFNAHLRDCVLLFADEAFYAGDKGNESVLKTIVTQPMLMFEQKGIDAEPMPNCTHLMMASNEKWVVPVGFDDRRYFVLDVLPNQIGNREYFNDMVHQFEKAGGREALLHFLLTYDIKASGVSIRDVPKTSALQEQKTMNMDPEIEWWFSILRRGTLLLDHDDWRDSVSADLLLLDFMYHTGGGFGKKKSSATKMGISLKDLLPIMEGEDKSVRRFQSATPIDVPRPGGMSALVARPWHYKLPPLEQCRAHFDTNYGGPYNWEADLAPQEIPNYEDIFQ